MSKRIEFGRVRQCWGFDGLMDRTFTVRIDGVAVGECYREAEMECWAADAGVEAALGENVGAGVTHALKMQAELRKALAERDANGRVEFSRVHHGPNVSGGSVRWFTVRVDGGVVGECYRATGMRTWMADNDVRDVFGEECWRGCVHARQMQEILRRQVVAAAQA